MTLPLPGFYRPDAVGQLYMERAALAAEEAVAYRDRHDIRASSMDKTFAADAKYLGCIRAGLLAHVSGYAPAVSVEFARKTLLAKDRPSFFEVEEAVAALPPV